MLWIVVLLFLFGVALVVIRRRSKEWRFLPGKQPGFEVLGDYVPNPPC